MPSTIVAFDPRPVKAPPPAFPMARDPGTIVDFEQTSSFIVGIIVLHGHPSGMELPPNRPCLISTHCVVALMRLAEREDR
jgi:hypothetical protein